ncbi:MAG: tryptophan--tRNA ligase [Bacteroidota bacterium]
MENRKTVLSCIQPTGEMHFGNYFGAVKNWVDLQASYDCFIGVVDYHAMTMPYSPKKLRENTWDLLISLMAVGIEPNNLFVQSLVPEHAELGWIMNCFSSYGEVTRMTQFKDKSAKSASMGDNFISVGLFDYPVLQAADILIYKADYVPIGKDQVQHLELTRNIAQRFNHQIGKEYFVLPEPLFTKTPSIKSTADPTKKMSKSAGEKHWISIFAEEARLRKQIRSAVTDTGDTPAGTMSAGVANLFELLQAAGNMDAHAKLMADYEAGELRYSDLKAVVADSLVALNSKFVEKKKELLSNKKEVKNQIKASSHEIRKRAQQTLKEVKELTGLLNVRF